MPKAQKPPRHEGLASQYLQEPGAEAAARQTRKSLGRPSTRTKREERDEDDESFVDAKMSRKILDLARRQQEEIEDEDGAQNPSRLAVQGTGGAFNAGRAAGDISRTVKARDTLNDPRIMPDDSDDDGDDRHKDDDEDVTPL